MLIQETRLRNFQDEEIMLDGKFEDDCKVQARAIYQKNLQGEEAKLFAIPINLKVTSSWEGVEEQKIEDTSYDCKTHETYLKNLLEEESKLFSLLNDSNVISALVELGEGKERQHNFVNDGQPQTELNDLNQLKHDAKCEVNHFDKEGLRQSELDLKFNLKKVDKDAKGISKLKLHHVPHAPLLCPSPQMQKAIIASRPLVSTLSSPMASSHGDQEGSDLTSLNENFQVTDHGPIQPERIYPVNSTLHLIQHSSYQKYQA